MNKSTNSQSVGLITLMIAITCVVAYFSLRSGRRQSLPPLTVTGPQPAVASSAPNRSTSEDEAAPTANHGEQATGVSAAPEIMVHVAGAVFRPDVYRLPAGSRVTDAIRAAGGATQFADTNAINLAAPVQDGSKILVPRYSEQASQQQAIPPGTSTATNTPPSSDSQQQPTQDDAASPSVGGNQTQASGKVTDAAQGAVNINTAGSEELQRLPGVGPAIAQRIVDYRQTNGLFRTAEDLKNVSGIGEKKYAKLAAFITVN